MNYLHDILDNSKVTKNNINENNNCPAPIFLSEENILKDYIGQNFDIKVNNDLFKDLNYSKIIHYSISKLEYGISSKKDGMKLKAKLFKICRHKIQ